MTQPWKSNNASAWRMNIFSNGKNILQPIVPSVDPLHPPINNCNLFEYLPLQKCFSGTGK